MELFRDRSGSSVARVSYIPPQKKQLGSPYTVNFQNRSVLYSSYLGQVADREPLWFSFSPEPFMSVYADESPERWMCRPDPDSKAFVQQQ